MTPAIAAVLDGSARWCVVHDDNAKVLPTLGDRSVTHVITDPPFESEAHTLGRRLIQHADRTRPFPAPLSFAAITESDRETAATQFARLAGRWVIVFAQVEAVMCWQAALTSGGALSPRRIGVWIKPDGMP